MKGWRFKTWKIASINYFYLSAHHVKDYYLINKRFANIAPTSTTERGEEEWYRMIRRVESLNPLVFPDEAQKRNIVVTIKDGRLRLEYSSDKAPAVPSCEITVLHVVDGMSPSFRAPYLAHKRR